MEGEFTARVLGHATLEEQAILPVELGGSRRNLPVRHRANVDDSAVGCGREHREEEEGELEVAEEVGTEDQVVTVPVHCRLRRTAEATDPTVVDERVDTARVSLLELSGEVFDRVGICEVELEHCDTTPPLRMLLRLALLHDLRQSLEAARLRTAPHHDAVPRGGELARGLETDAAVGAGHHRHWLPRPHRLRQRHSNTASAAHAAESNTTRVSLMRKRPVGLPPRPPTVLSRGKGKGKS